jgi:small-conductance mechanosensitive channel
MRKFLETKGYVVITAILVLLTMYSLLTTLDKKKVKLPNPLEQKVVKAELDRLSKEKKALEHKLDSQEKVSKNLVGQVDSLGHLKPKIHIEYVNKENEINNSYSATLVSEFDSVFAKNNIGY